MTKQPGVATGAVHQVYTPTKPGVFRKVKDLDDFENNGIYICCGAETVDKTRRKNGLLIYPTNSIICVVSQKFLELQEEKFKNQETTSDSKSDIKSDE